MKEQVQYLSRTDGDTTNDFLVERQMIRLTFPELKVVRTSQLYSVPCGEMYGDTCPVLTEVRPGSKDAKEDMGL